MSKRTNYNIGTAMVIIGGLLYASMYKYLYNTGYLFLLWLSCITIIGGGLLLIYITRDLHKASENIQRIEQSIKSPDPAQRIVITITVNDLNIEIINMTLQETISALEISKIQLIHQYTVKPIEIVKNK